jgi:Double-GTPase 2
LSEIAGDVFRLAKDSTDECRRLTIGRRADHFVILVDGAKLVQRQHRFTTINDAGMFLRSCLDADMLGRSSFVDMLVTKWDVAGTVPELPEVEQILTAFVERTRQHCEARLGRLRFLRVAARPLPRYGLPFAHGLSDVVASWVTESPRFRELSPATAPMPEDASEFDRYLWRQLPALRPRGSGGNGARV